MSPSISITLLRAFPESNFDFFPTHYHYSNPIITIAHTSHIRLRPSLFSLWIPLKHQNTTAIRTLSVIYMQHFIHRAAPFVILL